MIYSEFKDKHQRNYLKYSKQYKLIGSIRLGFILAFLVCGYYFFKTENYYLLIVMFLFATLFFIVLNRHLKISWTRRAYKTLVQINEDEIQYLEGKEMPFDNGKEFVDFTHTYTHDLDVFGEKSLFQNLNRTATFVGKQKLAHSLVNKLDHEKIKLNQEAIKELAGKIEWRQKVLMLGKMANDNSESYDELMNWSLRKSNKLSKTFVFITYLTPALFIISLLLYFFTKETNFFQLATAVFFFNLFFFLFNMKRIHQELLSSDKINEITKQYSSILEEVEKEEFKSEKINHLKQKLEEGKASLQIRKLSSLFSNLDNVQNIVGAILFNSALLYHFHTLKSLMDWKEKHTQKIVQWLDVIGEIEALNSLANFSYNNPSFSFPEINHKHEFVMRDLGHPMLKAEQRVNNDVTLVDQKFIILTGSNMSGKSTFLRTLGVNLILGNTGAPMCASYANIHPLDILVSMRLSDSLSDNESYFFAEVKRLKLFMDILNQKPCFVLLDEILRGTNSDDKRNGTIEVIKKVISKDAIGVIATHDLEVCQIAKDYPNQLINKCFEVEIINNDLSFDYKLRDGICRNKSASFLMKKMEII